MEDIAFLESVQKVVTYINKKENPLKIKIFMLFDGQLTSKPNKGALD